MGLIDPDLLAQILWAGFYASLLLGGIAVRVTSDAAALAAALAAVALLGVFSFLGGFSIGPFTAVIPALLTALAATRHRRLDVRAAAVLLAFAAYLATVWLPRIDYGLLVLPPLELSVLIAAAILSSRSSSRSSAAP